MPEAVLEAESTAGPASEAQSAKEGLAKQIAAAQEKAAAEEAAAIAKAKAEAEARATEAAAKEKRDRARREAAKKRIEIKMMARSARSREEDQRMKDELDRLNAMDEPRRARPSRRPSRASARASNDDPLAGLDGMGSSPIPAPRPAPRPRPAPVEDAEGAEEPEPEPEPVDPLAVVDRLLDGLGLANLAFSPPGQMVMEEKRVVELLLSPEQSTEVLKAQLAGADEASVQTAVDIKVSPRMEATLTGPGFSVEALTPPEQVVSRSGVTRWSWSVTPTTPGSQFLHLSLSARIEVEGRDTPFVVRTFDRVIEVEVTAMQQAKALVSEHGQWLWSTVLVPAFFWWRNKRKRARLSERVAKVSEPPAGE